MDEIRQCSHATPANLPCIQCCLTSVFQRTGDVPDSLLHLLHEVQEHRLARGDCLYREGDHARSLTIINSGLVKLTQVLANGQQRIVRLLHAGDIIGLESLVNHVCRHTATAVTESRVCAVPTALIFQLEALDPHVYERLMTQWQHSLDEADSFITELSTGTAEGRLARLLLKLSERCDGTVFPALSREEIGSIIGVSTETASRMMARFKREGLIREHDDTFSRCDVPALTLAADS